MGSERSNNAVLTACRLLPLAEQRASSAFNAPTNVAAPRAANYNSNNNNNNRRLRSVSGDLVQSERRRLRPKLVPSSRPTSSFICRLWGTHSLTHSGEAAQEERRRSLQREPELDRREARCERAPRAPASTFTFTFGSGNGRQRRLPEQQVATMSAGARRAATCWSPRARLWRCKRRLWSRPKPRKWRCWPDVDRHTQQI